MYNKIWMFTKCSTLFLLMSALMYFLSGALAALAVMAFVGKVSWEMVILWGLLAGWMAGFYGGILHLYRNNKKSINMP